MRMLSRKCEFASLPFHTRAVGADEPIEVDMTAASAAPISSCWQRRLTRVVRDHELAAELERGPPAEARTG